MTTREQAESTWDRFMELEDGFFVVQRPFENPFHDKRVRYSFERHSMFPAGERFEVLTKEGTIKIASQVVPYVERVVKFNRQVVLSGRKDAYFPEKGKIDKASDKNLTFLELLMACTERDNRDTLGHILRVELADKEQPSGRALVGLLLDTGKVDLGDVRGAIEAWQHFREDETDDLYARHGLE